jgi:hypothetical protein
MQVVGKVFLDDKMRTSFGAAGKACRFRCPGKIPFGLEVIQTCCLDFLPADDPTPPDKISASPG